MPEPVIHIGIPAWRRPEYLERTLRSLDERNDLDGSPHFRLWCALDGGHDPKAARLLADYGFDLAGWNRENRGIAATFSALIAGIAREASPRDLVLTLESDWVSLRPIPVEPIRAALATPGIGWVWLFGRDKGESPRGKESCFQDDDNRGMRGWPRIEWRAETFAGEVLSVGRSYWPHPPTVARLPVAVGCAVGAKGCKDSARRSVRLDMEGAWTEHEPVFRHIGATSAVHDLGGKK